MSRTHWPLIAMAVAAALGVGVMVGRVMRPDTPKDGGAEPTAKAARKPLYYRNPMGLPDTSPVPKKDSMGMDYIPVYAEDDAASVPGTVVLSPERVQMLGVRTEQVRLRPLERRVEASGTVAVDETRQYEIAPRFEGWVERLHANQTGQAVRRGEPLLTVYSPQLMAAQEEYRIADAAARRLSTGDADAAKRMGRLRDAARDRLRNWEISDAQLAHLGHKPSGNLVLTSPANAVVMEKPVVQGARFEAGETVLRLADLSTVWVVANVPASQAGSLRTGQAASFSSPTLPGQRFDGQVTFIQPVIDAATRTLGVRVALPNREGVLRPGLFGNVAFSRDDGPAVLAVPRSALIDSGTRQIVLVQVSEGRFAPRRVVVGRRAADSIEVLEGLAEGERVVVAANFLLDAESNLQSALAGMGTSSAEPGEPITSMRAEADVVPAEPSDAAAGVQNHEHSGQSVTSPGSKPTPGVKPVQTPSDPHVGHGEHDSHEEPAAQGDPHAGHDMSGMEH
ncbi:efflux RND transporter periplasmic adaptor subunit [Aerolutibacter daejeonensis]|uniref:efflux RND transporter periplasmic adaptor subunit n=1 Tax=Aerolutibacter daejeonensis TaxID=346181 RepID=UPI00068B7AF1|nr:efflux RND transporter periplasmic adaptor subunit [Lysobacter daejeonensis]